MRHLLFFGALGLIGIWLYDEVAFQINDSKGTQATPFLWTNQTIPEYWLPLVGAGIITTLAVTA